MENQFTVISWNCHRAKADSRVWGYLLEHNPDMALLQEVGDFPKNVLDRFEVYHQRANLNNGSSQKFSTALLVQGKIGDPILITGMAKWADAELERFAGNLICREVFLSKGPMLKVISVYNPAWPINATRLEGIDLSGVRLTQNSGLWLADILWASLKHQQPNSTDNWIVAGDFNLSETFDRIKPRGNREYLQRMTSLGFTECLRKSKGVLTPTFRNTQGGAIKHQMDHMFVTEALASKLLNCDIGLHERVFEENLSDHLPLIAQFLCQ